MDETWEMSPLNPNSQNNQTTYTYGSAVPSDTGSPEVTDPNRTPDSGGAIFAIIVVIAVLVFFPNLTRRL